jgi:hypothetical protein
MIAREYKITKTKLGGVVTYGSPRHSENVNALAKSNASAAVVMIHGDWPMHKLPEGSFGVSYIAHDSYPTTLKKALALAVQNNPSEPYAFIRPEVVLNDDIAHYFDYLDELRLGRAYGSYVLDEDGDPIVVIISGDLLQRANRDCPDNIPLPEGLPWLHSFGNRFIRSPRYFDATNLAIVARYAVPSIIEEVVVDQQVPEQPEEPVKRKPGRPKKNR